MSILSFIGWSFATFLVVVFALIVAIFVIALVKVVKSMKPKAANIYCGTEDYVEFFEQIISTLGIEIKYEVRNIDGEYEICVK